MIVQTSLSLAHLALALPQGVLAMYFLVLLMMLCVPNHSLLKEMLLIYDSL